MAKGPSDWSREWRRACATACTLGCVLALLLSIISIVAVYGLVEYLTYWQDAGQEAELWPV